MSKRSVFIVYNTDSGEIESVFARRKDAQAAIRDQCAEVGDSADDYYDIIEREVQ